MVRPPVSPACLKYKGDWLTKHLRQVLLSTNCTYCCLWDITEAGKKTGAMKNDVSKVTLPAWPRQGYGRHRLSSGLLVQFVSCPYSDVFDFLYDSDLCIVFVFLTRSSRCYI